MRLVRLLTGVFVIWILSLPAIAGQDPLIREGIHYQVIPGVHVKSSDRIEVVEFFSYGCPHCHDFDPMIQAWAEKHANKVDFIRVPVTFRPGWDAYAAAYYTAELFNKLDAIHTDFFKAIHQGRQTLQTMGELTDFFAKHGIPADQFTKTISSFGVQVKMMSALKMATDYRVTGVPMLVVNKKYIVNAQPAGSLEGMLAVLDHLVQKELKSAKLSVKAK